MNGLAGQLVERGSSVPDAEVQSLARAYQSLQALSLTLSYIDTFKILAVAASIMFLFAFIVKKNDPKAGGQVHAE